MRYSSKLGCLLYQDDVLGSQCLCEPTMLFLLGLEAILSQNSDESNIHFSRESVGELFDDIYRYLYKLYANEQVTVNEISYNVYGLKKFMNTLTGTNLSRIVPIIFHDDNDEITLGFSENTTVNDKADKIHILFNSAGYESGDGALPLLSKYGVEDEASLQVIDEYNEALKEEHNIKKANAMIYKLLDYKAMYSYALGVLYGCKCLGYDESIIWRLEPSRWYKELSDLEDDTEDSLYTNLVNTAWDVFRFHYSHPIPRIDSDIRLACKYKGIQSNKLWNFNIDEYNFKSDEVPCHTLYIENGEEITFPLFYSQSTGPQTMPPGSYLLPDSSEWRPLDSSVIDSATGKGIVADDDNEIIRYLVNDEIHISKAYKYNKGKFLSPNRHTIHFVHEANLGWVDFIEDSYKRSTVDNPLLSLVPTGFDNISTDLLRLARDKESGNIIMYYHSYVTESNIDDNRRSLYGILPDDVTVASGLITVPDDTHFTNIVSDVSFVDKYEFPVEPDGYTLTPYYNITTPISIYVYDQDSTMMWNGNDTPTPISEFGYTLTPSEQLDTYVDSPNDEPYTFDLRYNSDEQYGYWSSTWDPKQWKSSLEEDIYKKEDLITLYKNESAVATLSTYNLLSDSLDDKYIFNNQSIPQLAELNHGFITLNDVYNAGISTHKCIIIWYDDFGNSLTDDDGNPLVWYDPEKELYWNGTYDINQWQTEKPSMFSKFIYNSSTQEMKQVNIKEDTHQIYIDNTVMGIEDFYLAYPTCRIICDTVKVFSSTHSSEGILDCYVDTFADEYCIPGKTEWVSRSAISDAGYRFVNGITTLYAGNTGIDVVYDIDDTD